MSEKDKYIVFGNPIAQSKSPQIHSLFAEQTKQAITYSKLLVEDGDFNREAQNFIDNGGRGINITAPFKEDAYNFADKLSERAEAAEAVNTLYVQDDGSVLGDNTDGAGLVWDITQRLGWAIKGKRLLILGAGGAVKGVLLPLLKESPELITIANRTVAKAEQLVERFQQAGKLSASSYAALNVASEFDIIINATSASLQGAVPELPQNTYSAATSIYDMVYKDELTPFLKTMQDNGAEHIADGFGMLIGQAAESFKLWRKVEPDISAVYQTLR